MSKKLSTLGVGTTFEVPVKSAYRSFLGDYVVFKMADKNHSGYPSGAITLITDKIIALLCSDTKEPNNSDSNRRSYGNNRHIHSNILQWLNSNAAAGKWYSAKHGQDAPPSSANVWDNVNPYDTWAGFLAMLDDDFVAALMTTTLTVAKNTVTDGGSYETFTAKMFLASTTEVGLANETGLQRVQSWPCSATTQAALPIVRKRPLTKVITGAIRRLRRRGIGGFARRIPATRTLCAMSSLRGRWATTARTAATGACVRFVI